MRDTQPFKHDEALRSRTAKLLSDNGWTQTVAAKIFNLSSATRLGKYLGLDTNEPEKDMPQVEISIKNWFRHQDRRESARLNLFENKVSKHVRAVLLTIRKTGDIGVIHGAAGLGKTSGIELFRSQYPNTIGLTVTRRRRYAREIENMLFEELNADDDWSCRLGIRKWEWMEKLLTGSERLIIVDNAHKLHWTGVDLLFDLHDVTGCPIALIGNLEVLNVVRWNDQLTSRIGLVHEIVQADDLKEVAGKLIDQYAPNANGALLEAAAAKLGESGHARALRKQLTITTDLVEKRQDKDWLRAFSDAGKKLVKPIAGARGGRR